MSPTHTLKIAYLCDLRKALKDIGKAVTLVTHIGVVENPACAGEFKFKEPEGNGTGETLFEVELARSTKLSLSLETEAVVATGAKIGKVLVKAVRRSKPA